MQKLIQRIMLLMFFLQVVYGDSTKEQIVVPMVGQGCPENEIVFIW